MAYLEYDNTSDLLSVLKTKLDNENYSPFLRSIWTKLTSMSRDGSKKILLYGAGQFTRKLILQNLFETKGPVIECILDDKAEDNLSLCGISIVKPSNFKFNKNHIVFISSDSHIDKMSDNIQEYTRDLENNVTICSIETLVSARKPTFSIMIPLYKANLTSLKESVESVQEQGYKLWELILIDNFSGDNEIIDYLESISNNPNIKVILRDTYGSESDLINDAKQISSNDYIAILDQEDVLSPVALAHAAQCVSENPDASLIHGEDKYIVVN